MNSYYPDSTHVYPSDSDWAAVDDIFSSSSYPFVNGDPLLPSSEPIDFVSLLSSPSFFPPSAYSPTGHRSNSPEPGDDDSDSDSDFGHGQNESDDQAYHIVGNTVYQVPAVLNQVYIPEVSSPSPQSNPLAAYTFMGTRDTSSYVDAAFPPTSFKEDDTFSRFTPERLMSLEEEGFGVRRSCRLRCDKDEEASESHDDDGDATDDEYIPSPKLSPRKRQLVKRRPASTIFKSRAQATRGSAPTSSSISKPISASSFSSSSSSSSSPSSSSSSSSASPSSISSVFGPSKRPRLCPATPQTPKTPASPWSCPICSHVQRNKRSPDLKRHIYAHERQGKEPEWICCGVPRDLAAEYGVPRDAPVMLWGEREMVGGCRHLFSRRDAYKRHLDNKKVNCIGDVHMYSRWVSS